MNFSKTRFLHYVLLVGLASLPGLTLASSVDFQPVGGAIAQQNFIQAEIAINDNDNRITSNDNRITSLESLVQQLVASNAQLHEQNALLVAQVEVLQEAATEVSSLMDYVEVEIDEYGYPAVIFDSVNVHIRNGNPETASWDGYGSNGLGNLIVGYNGEPQHNILGSQCSGGFFEHINTNPVIPTQSGCEGFGYTWAGFHKTGSHNLIIGPGNSYTGANNIVAGVGNMALDGHNLITGSYNLGGFAGTSLSGINNRAYYSGTILGTVNSQTEGMSTIIGGFGATINGGDVLVNGVMIEE